MKLPCFLAAVVIAATPATAMEFDCPAPGTTIEFDSGVKAIARGKEAASCVMEEGGKKFSMRGLMMANPGPDGSDTSALLDAVQIGRAHV